MSRSHTTIRTIATAAAGALAAAAVLGAAPAQAAAQTGTTSLAEVLAAPGPRTATVFGGDVNRQTGCAPRGAWALRDDSAAQAPGIQHVYGTRSGLLRPREEVLPMTYTDHDALLVRALLLPRGGA